MTDATDPLVPRPASTVMLLRDAGTPESLEIFLMRRHSAMDFVAGRDGLSRRRRRRTRLQIPPSRSAPAPGMARLSPGTAPNPPGGPSA